ncbi:MAG: EscU/YscU/HrcU family type III secretion system export apparatus switch protein [Planctomycetaceae bacterium]
MSSEPTLPASPTKRLAAKKRGNVVRSRQLVAASILLGATLLLQWQRTAIATELDRYLTKQFQLQTTLEKTSDQWVTVDFWLQQSLPILQALSPVILGIIAIALLSNMLQTGFIFAPGRISPDTSRLAPGTWWQRVNSAEHQLEAIGSLIRSMGLFALMALSLWAMREQIASLSLLPAGQIIKGIVNILSQILIRIGIVLLILGILDYGWQKLKWERALRMTPDELRDEQTTQNAIKHHAKPRKFQANRNSYDLSQSNLVLYIPEGPIVAIAYDHQQMDVPTIQQIWHPKPTSPEYSIEVLQMARDQGLRCLMTRKLTTLIANTLKPRQLVPPHLYQDVIKALRST